MSSPIPQSVDSDAVERLRALRRRASKGPWEIDAVCVEADPDFDGFVIYDGDGHAILDTMNSDDVCVEVEYCEDDISRWDQNGKLNTAFVVALVNWFDENADRLASLPQPAERARENAPRLNVILPKHCPTCGARQDCEHLAPCPQAPRDDDLLPVPRRIVGAALYSVRQHAGVTSKTYGELARIAYAPALASLPQQSVDSDAVERVARAICAADRLDWDEKCAYEVDPDADSCDSSTCPAALSEEHDIVECRSYYRAHALAALSQVGSEAE